MSRQRLASVAIAVMALLAVLLGLWLGNGRPGATYDTAFYMSAANNLAHGRGLVSDATVLGTQHLTEPFKRWAPLFPVLSSVPILFGMDSLLAVGLLAALSFGLIVVFIGLLGWRFSGPVAGAIAAAFALLSLSYWQLSAYALSDATFVAFVAATLWLFAEWQVTRERRWLLLSCVAAAGTVLTRHIGVTLVVGLCLWMAFEAIRSRSWRLFGTAWLYGIAAGTPIAAYVLTHPFWSGEGAINPAPPAAPFADNLGFWFRTMRQDFGLSRAGLSTIVGPLLVGLRLVGIVVVLVFIAYGLYTWLARDSREFPALMAPSVVYFLTYILLITWLRSIGSFAALETRLVSPTYPGLFASAGAIAVLLGRRALKLDRAWLRGAGVTCMAIVLLSLVQWNSMAGKASNLRSGLEGSSARWTNDKACAIIRRLKPDVVLSDSRAFVLINTRIPTKHITWKREGSLLWKMDTPLLRESNDLVFFTNMDSFYQSHVLFDTRILLDPTKFEVLYQDERDLLVRPKVKVAY